MKEICIARLSAGSVFKLVGIGLLCSMLPLTILMGVTAYFGLNSLVWNGQPVTGITALITAPFMGLFLVALFTALHGTSIAFGLWVYSFIGPLEIAFKLPPVKPEQVGEP
ncbi:hypothetical protein [Luteimonas sp. A277]